MVQSLLLVFMVVLCVLLIISILQKPFDNASRNPCRFKILDPKYVIEGKKKTATFEIIIEKQHRYFINFPLSFKFYSDQKFKTLVKISYTNPAESVGSQLLLDKWIEFTNKTKEHIVYITDVFVGKVIIEVMLEVDYGNPIVGFQILENKTCDLTKEHKLELKFPS